jgi:hypothetical protein
MVRSLPPYQQRETVIGAHSVSGSSATTERFRQPFAFRPGPPHLTGAARRGRFVQSGVQPKASYEGYRVGEPPAAIEEPQGSIPAVGDGHDPALRIPAPETRSSSCQAHSLIFLCRLPCSWQ